MKRLLQPLTAGMFLLAVTAGPVLAARRSAPPSARSTAMSSCAMSSSPLAKELSARAVTRSCNSVRVEESEEISAAEVMPR